MFSNFRIPSEEFKREYWATAIFDATGQIMSEKALICSKHFIKESFFSDISNRRKLHTNAVPVIFPDVLNQELELQAPKPRSAKALKKSANKTSKIKLKNVLKLTAEDIQNMTESEAKESLIFLVGKYNALLKKKPQEAVEDGALQSEFKSDPLA